ncbi:hypothetical protein ACFW96_36365 [Streptomyces gardneri]|uniref:hypothetical protein n=1 Tax=Streptomyces gardneri TaxID=66892 RepID=UPI0036A204B8
MSAPLAGGEPPVVFPHGFGWSMDGCAQPADHWDANGFMVVQPSRGGSWDSLGSLS